MSMYYMFSIQLTKCIWCLSNLFMLLLQSTPNTPPPRLLCWRYASYWNAFLFNTYFSLLLIKFNKLFYSTQIPDKFIKLGEFKILKKEKLNCRIVLSIPIHFDLPPKSHQIDQKIYSKQQQILLLLAR